MSIIEKNQRVSGFQWAFMCILCLVAFAGCMVGKGKYTDALEAKQACQGRLDDRREETRALRGELEDLRKQIERETAENHALMEELARIDGVTGGMDVDFLIRGHLTVYIDPRYDKQSVLDEITRLGTVKTSRNF